MTEKLAVLRSAVQSACQPTGADKITQARDVVLKMDRDFTLANIERVARECLNLDDYWEYRRLLELCNLLDAGMTQRVARWGIAHNDPDVREAAMDFTEQGVGD